MSICLRACCVEHQEDIFLRVDVQPFVWVHVAGMTPCDAMPPATPEQAEEICACGHHEHHAIAPAIEAGQIARLRPCATPWCPCPDFIHRWQVRSEPLQLATATRPQQEVPA